jgi:hypothetical protein
MTTDSLGQPKLPPTELRIKNTKKSVVEAREREQASPVQGEIAPVAGSIRSQSSHSDACDLWWTLMVGRLNELRVAFPATLKGTIQICAPSFEARPTRFHYIRLDGPRSAAYEGVADEPDVWIELDEEKLGALLRDEPHYEGAMRSSGKHELWRSLFERLQEQGQPKSWLQIRGMK